jgi:hypothetical protein
VTETLFQELPIYGYKYLIYEGQSVGSPFLTAQKLIDELEYVENSLIFGNDEEGITYTDHYSSEHEKLLYTDACDLTRDRSKDDCEEVWDKVMTQGIHSSIVTYIALARTLIINI